MKKYQSSFSNRTLNFLYLLIFVLYAPALIAQDCQVLDPNIAGVYTGNCKNGKASGLGKSIGKYTYEGEFKFGLPDGKGQITDSLGFIMYIGNFRKGKRDGEGVAKYHNSEGLDSVLNGFFRNDKYVGLYENPFKLINKTFMISTVSITYENPTPPNSTIELSMESVSGGAFNVHGEIPKPTLGEAIFQKGSYLQMMPVTNQQKRNTYIFQNLMFPAHVIFKISNEELVIEFNEPKNYKVFVTLRD